MKKENLPQNSFSIEVGSEVMFIDGSYTLSIKHDSTKLKNTHLGLSEEVYTVVAINVPCPTTQNDANILGTHNNCIVKDSKGGIHFCSSINIKNIKGY